jgi:hypothetical protein
MPLILALERWLAELKQAHMPAFSTSADSRLRGISLGEKGFTCFKIAKFIWFKWLERAWTLVKGLLELRPASMGDGLSFVYNCHTRSAEAGWTGKLQNIVPIIVFPSPTEQFKSCERLDSGVLVMLLTHPRKTPPTFLIVCCFIQPTTALLSGNL